MTQTTPGKDTGDRSGAGLWTRRWGPFARHYGEMVIAMFVGMGVLDLLWSAIGVRFSYDRDPELAYLLMAFDMSVGMAVWMRVRGHARAPALQMCAVMFAPVVPLFPLLWTGVIDGMALMVAAHVAMFPLMLAAMLWRRDEYTHAHSREPRRSAIRNH